MKISISKSLPKAAGLKYEDVVDTNITENLDKSGFIDALYKLSEFSSVRVGPEQDIDSAIAYGGSKFKVR